MYLVDTNLLLRLVDRSHSVHPTIRAAIRKLRQNGDSLHITSQNCVEFWNVATRPIQKNGFGVANFGLRNYWRTTAKTD